MNYIKQLNEFYSTLDYKPLSASAIAMYMFLLHIANKTGWIDEFKVANSILIGKCKLTLSSLQRARNELITQNYIDYKKGLNQNDASRYKIIKLYFEQADEQANEQADEQANEQAPELATEHINKQNKTKQNKIEEKKKKKRTFEDVFSANNFSDELKNTLRDFIDMRKTIQKPMTTKALELLLKNLDRLTNLEAEKIEILNQSIVHGWQSVYPLKLNQKLETMQTKNQKSWEEWANE